MLLISDTVSLYNSEIAVFQLLQSIGREGHNIHILQRPIASLQFLKEHCTAGTGHQHGAHSHRGTEEVIRVVRGMRIQVSAEGLAHETVVRAISRIGLWVGIAGWARRICVVVVKSTTIIQTITVTISYNSIIPSSTDINTHRILYTAVTECIEVGPRGTEHHRRRMSRPFTDSVLVPQSGGKEDADVLTRTDDILNLGGKGARNCQQGNSTKQDWWRRGDSHYRNRRNIIFKSGSLPFIAEFTTFEMIIQQAMCFIPRCIVVGAAVMDERALWPIAAAIYQH